jgi:hypothetical protein
MAALAFVVLFCTGHAGAAPLVYHSPSASGFGLLPSVSLSQGTASGIADGRMFTGWFSGATSPRVFSPATNLQPYMTWSSPQTVGAFRVWQDAASNWDRLMIDVLAPSGNPTVEGDWVNQYDSGTGLVGVPANFQEFAMTAVVTQGVRVRAFTTGGDTDVGEANVFGNLGGTLSSFRKFPTSIAASSSEFRPAGEANDANWFNSWLSATPGSNPGSDFTYDLNYAGGQNLSALGITWSTQPGFANVVPASWEILIDTGSGLTSFGTFSKTTAQNGQDRGQYYIDLGGMIGGVQQVRLRIPEGADRVSMTEFEAFMIPEPTSAALLLGLGAFVGLRRARR